MTYNDGFDQILDHALTEYREAEPLAGLEDRVLQRLRLQTESRRKLWWRWSAITAVAAALALAAWLGLENRTRQGNTASSAVPEQSAPPGQQAQAGDAGATSQQLTSRRPLGAKRVSPSVRMPAAAQLAGTEHPPIREQFPSPAPLQPEERMLLALATTHPEVLMERADQDKEIAIAPINITPLVKETGGYQGEN